MYKTVLVKQMIDEGAELLRKLDDGGIPVQAAAWFDDPEKLSWKLVIVTPVAELVGPLEAYLQIQKAMSGLKTSIALDDIIAMGPSSRKFQEFRRTMEGAATPSVGVAFDDAYVYRWHVN
jgi:hypothetical protein